MLITVTNVSTNPVYISQFYRQLAASEAITVRRTMADVDGDDSLKALVRTGVLTLTFTAEAGDELANADTPGDGGFAVEMIYHKLCPAGGVTGTPDDVTIFNANAPFAFEIMDVQLVTSTNISMSTCTLRTAAAGGGTAVSDALSSGSTGIARNSAKTDTPAIAKGGSLFLRRSDRAVAGELIIRVMRTAKFGLDLLRSAT